MRHDVVIIYNNAIQQTLIDIDNVRQEKVIDYSLSQKPGNPPRFKIVQHNGNIDPLTNSWEEVTREFTPAYFTYKTI